MDSHTVVNDWLFDEVMPKTGHAAFKVVCAVVRKTWGFTKEWDEISFSQFIEVTGISGRNNVSNGIQEAIDKGYIEREKWGSGFRYRVVSSNVSILDYVKQLLNDTSTSNEKLPNEQPASNEKLHTKALDSHTHTAREEMPADAPPIHSGFAFEHEPTGKALEYQHQIDEMAAVLATVTRMDLGLNKEKLEDQAVALLENKYTPAQVTAAFYGDNSYWRLMSYGGKKGDTPKFGNIRSEIAKAVKWDGKVPAAATNGNGRHATNGTGDEDSTLWAYVMRQAQTGDPKFDDPRVLAAVRPYWPRIKTVQAGSFDESKLRQDFLRAYHAQSATTPA
jgi:hypothetical protein